MLVDLSNDDKVKIIQEGFNNTWCEDCGHFVHVGCEGLKNKSIECYINTDRFELIALTEFGTYHYNYDFDFSFDENLYNFIDDLSEYLTECINNKD